MSKPGAEFVASHEAPQDHLVVADIILVADFSRGELGWRLESDIRAQAEWGYRTALIHVPTGPRSKATIHPDIAACVAEGLAEPVEPAARAIKARLVVVYEPEQLFGSLFAGRVIHLPRLLADRVIALTLSEGGAAEPVTRQVDVLLRSLFGATTVWAAETKAGQTRLRESGVRVIDDNWRPSLPSIELRPAASWRRTTPTVGLAGQAAVAWLRASAEEMTGALSVKDRAAVKLLLPAEAELEGVSVPEAWHIARSDETSLKSFLLGLDFFVFAPSQELEPPFIAIATALSMGIPTVLHPRLEPYFGDAALYADGDDVARLITRHFAGLSRDKWSAERSAASARKRFGPQIQGGRLTVLAGAPTTMPRRPRSRPQRRAVFFSSDTIGLGHLTRQLAVARRLPRHVEPVFVTTNQAFRVAAQAGFAVEYLPSVELARFERQHWEEWLGESLNQIVDQYDARCLVFDGATPHDGVLASLRANRHLNSVWIRRGLWRKQHTRHLLDRQSRFSLVIAPGDIAAANDHGPTVGYRRGVLDVPPIRLLDQEELFSRKEAAARIGIDPNRPAILIQLGGGATRDVVSIVDTILESLATRPEVQPVVADWNTAPLPDELWPTVRRIRAFPLSRYFPAFDFTISAAGYNSFNEIISFGLPAIFLPNDNGAVDDQPARATYAEEQSAALCFTSRDSVQLRVAISTLLQDRARWFLADNCRRIALPNGAAAAADAIASLV
ncbi:MAG: hypothetical protein IT535_09930 [Bauldia sp.]|nr:hypothetical protein [Bauldia sp.]